MNWKNRLTNYNFWISIFSAVLLILQALKIEFDIAYINEIFTAVLGLLVVIGIISDPTRASVKQSDLNLNANTKIETKMEEIKQEKIEEKEEEKVPTIEKNETDNLTCEIDFQTILNKISTDLTEKVAILSEKFENLKNFNQETKIEDSLQQENIEKNIDDIKENVCAENPAAAEMSNPYINVIN